MQLTGGNDFMNTIIPYNNNIYYDNRQLVRIEQDQVLPINNELAFNPFIVPPTMHRNVYIKMVIDMMMKPFTTGSTL